MFSPCVTALGVQIIFESAAISYFRRDEVLVYLPCGCLHIREIAKHCCYLLQLLACFNFCPLATVLQKRN